MSPFDRISLGGHGTGTNGVGSVCAFATDKLLPPPRICL